MASLLNMLNNFLGSAGKSSLFNVDSSSTVQSADFKNIISNVLSGVEGDQQTVNGLLLSPTGGLDLPLPVARGNGLPPLLATAAAGIDASLPLPDAEVSPGQLPDADLPLNALADNGELLVTQTPNSSPVSAHIIDPSTLPVSSLELPLAPGIDVPADAVGSQTPQLSGAGGQVTNTQVPVVENTLTTRLATPLADPVVRLAELNTNTTRPVKLDSAEKGVDQSVDSTLTSSSLSVSATPVEPALVVPMEANQAPAALSAEARQQVNLANDAINPGATNANVSTPATAAKTPTHPAAQLADLDAAVPIPLNAKDPQQLLVEQALGNSTTSDNDTSPEPPRQSLLPPSQPMRPAPTAQAPQQTVDANFANVASMLNQGQTMNSLNERLQFMLLNGQNTAEIQLDPPELGSLQVRVTTRNEQTSVIFVAPNNVVRDALEQQMPRLRDALESAGLQLQDANVFAQTDDKPGSQPQSYADVEAADSLLAEELDDHDGGAIARRVSVQLVDAYI